IKFYSKPTNNNLRTSSTSQSANKKQEFVKSDDKKVEKNDDEKKGDMRKVKCYNCKNEGHFAKDCKKAKTKVLQDQLKVKHVVINTHSECQAQYAKLEEERYEYMIRYSALYDNDKQHRKKINKQEILLNKMSRQLVEMNNNMLRLQEKILEKETKILELEGCTIHMIMPSKDTLYNGRKGIGFYFEKAKDWRPSLYDENVIGLGYTLVFLIHSKEALEIVKFKRARENKIEFSYDYGNLNASYVNEKIKFLDDYFQEIINPEKTITDLEDEVVSLLEKEKANMETIESLKSKDLDTFSSVRRPKHSGVIWKKKGSSNTSNVELSSVSHLKLNKDVKRYSRKDLLSCNNSHLGETSSAYVCNDAMNVSCSSRLCDSFDENNLFIFDDESVRISLVSKMPFRIKPCDSLNVRSKHCPDFFWIIDSGCLKHMTGNRALLTNFKEKFLGTICFGNYDFVVIVGYRDVVIGSMTIKKVYYVEGLGHNLFSVGQFCDKGLEVAFRKSTCFVRNKDGVELLTGDCSSNLYTNTLNEVASNSSTCLLAKASSLKSWLWHQRLSHLNFATINNLVKNNLVQGDTGVFVGYSKESATFRIYNKRTCKIHESVNVNFDEISKMAYNQFSLEPGLSNLNETRKSSNPLVSQVSETSKKDLEDLFQNFYDEYFDSSKIMKSSTTNVETSNVKVPLNEEVFYDSCKSFQKESSSSSLNDDVQQSSEEIRVISSNTQSISNNIIPNIDEASTSHNVFNERLEDAYVDASTPFHDPSNVHTFYQPYPHEKKWTKDHLLHKIIGDLKSSVRTRGQLANLFLFSCLLSSIETANVAEALRDAN
nr:integrase, catalytic region, zinc finger, CCHC-type, peptidase aspartic, catalytic [Tanacetum cinerariifolium]